MGAVSNQQIYDLLLEISRDVDRLMRQLTSFCSI